LPLRIVTDSTADLDSAEAEALGISVVPLSVYFGREAFLDRVDISPENFYSRLVTSKVTPRTSQPSVAAFSEVYSRLAQEGATEILSVHISSKLSGTLNAAQTAAKQAEPQCRVQVIDSRTVCGGLGEMVRRAAEIARCGGSLDEARAAVQALSQQHEIRILLDTLEYLQKGGRIGRARAFLGGVLNVKPIVVVQDGEVAPEERVRSRSRGIDLVFQRAVSVPGLDRVIVQHTGCPADAAALASRIRAAVPGAPVEIRWIGPVVGVYAGPNGIGTVCVRRTPGTV
jgi:DegV family protein with EDD domain